MSAGLNYLIENNIHITSTARIPILKPGPSNTWISKYSSAACAKFYFCCSSLFVAHKLIIRHFLLHLICHQQPSCSSTDVNHPQWGLVRMPLLKHCIRFIVAARLTALAVTFMHTVGIKFQVGIVCNHLGLVLRGVEKQNLSG